MEKDGEVTEASGSRRALGANQLRQAEAQAPRFEDAKLDCLWLEVVVRSAPRNLPQEVDGF